MPTILGIIRSPRKRGNTDVLVRAVLETAREEGAEVEGVHLGGMCIEECDGCHACWRGQECPRADDMNPLYDRIAAADAIVFGTPVYWYGPTALMKASIDRLVYFNCPENREKIRGKLAAVVVAFEEGDPAVADLLLEMMRKSFEYLELRAAGEVVVPDVTRRGEVADKPEATAQARALGKHLASEVW